ncbi:efflux RND transporter periplasmic adaptor subunit [Methylomicrobium sp. Wu6]|uniref:efflux RND transporter periplasmic adaptor subunit n=1 Tax=Methylomicrobium sp. Wu6 TaxID=3107928 RepID=UPI002DD67117|nr:efflux RND transporter periplasmic adaptor subunit [Methylomicrobium sp. Wu6]MEC4747239.1 efflux RND transporter periplasmic adaptor subunit [Methylomicrobium sp. Wu6]
MVRTNFLATTVGRKTKPLPSILLILVVTLACGGCDRAQQQPAAQAPTVEVVDVVQRDVPLSQEWVGTLDGMVNAQILAQVTGYLIKQNYLEGNPVKKGALLYEIDPRTFQAAVDEAQSNLARQDAEFKTARLALKRIERLLPEKAVSVRDWDTAVGREAQAQADVFAARAALEKAKLQLGFTRITSPIDGIAGISRAQLGNLVGPGSANAVLTTVSQVDPIKAFIPLSEQQYLQVAMELNNKAEVRQPPKLELTLADGSTYPETGQFYFADRQVDVKTGTIQVAVLFKNPGNILRPGQFAKIRAIRTKQGALLVPQRAVSEMQGKYLTAVVKPDNTVAIRMVKPAERIGSMWVIDEGLQPGERVVAEGVQKVKEGMAVVPKPFADPSDTAPAAKTAG